MLFKRLQIRSLKKKLKSMQHNRQLNQPSDEVLAKEVAIYMALSKMYHAMRKKKKYPYADIMVKETLRGAATIDSAEAQFQLGKMLMEEARFRDSLETEGLFASASNQRQAVQLFEEAHACLQRAEEIGHILAKRLRGLAIINGWGVASDKDRGFELVMASIEQENSWDKVPQIFAAMGLNKPEFFSALGQRKSNKP